MKKVEIQMTQGSGDVFTDLGFSASEAQNLRMRSQLMTALRKWIERESITQAEAAKRLQVSQPRISDLLRGRISRFSLDALVNLVGLTGIQLDLRIKPAPRRAA
jgi:predicted XRE-type DNA-binding protein